MLNHGIQRNGLLKHLIPVLCDACVLDEKMLNQQLQVFIRCLLLLSFTEL